MPAELQNRMTPVLKGKCTTWPPLLLLLLSLLSVFLFGGDRGHFYRKAEHNFNSVKTLLLAENLSPTHNFRLFERLSPEADGTPAYVMYSRFPLGGYILIKLALLPFEALTTKIYAGRLLMLLLFGATAVVAYQSLVRLTADRWVALTATFLTFSSFHLLYYSDQIYNETNVDLFAVILTFHGMIVFRQEGRFRQLVGRTCLALFMGWHVYGLLLAFIGFGMASEIVSLIKARSLPYPLRIRKNLMRTPGARLLPSYYLRLGAVALLFGMGLLTFNFANEYTALEGKKSLIQLPSVRSMLARTGLGQLHPDYAHVYALNGDFLREQFARIGVMSLPYALPVYGKMLGSALPRTPPGEGLAVVIGVFITAACLIGLPCARAKILMATLALSGFCWALPMRHTTYFHPAESVFYIGLILSFFSLVLLSIRTLFGSRFIVGLAIAALAIFVLSGFRMNRLDHNDATPEFHAAIIADFEVIRKRTHGRTVFIADSEDGMNDFVGFRGAAKAVDFYLSGSRILYANHMNTRFGIPDFVISRERYEHMNLLTPSNELVFLYDSVDVGGLYSSTYQNVVSGRPAGRATFDLYLGNGELTYVKDPCTLADIQPRFFLHVFRGDRQAASPSRWHSSVENRDFRFDEHGGVIFDSKCLLMIPTPYFINRIRTGQYTDAGVVWQTEFPVKRWTPYKKYERSMTPGDAERLGS